MVKLSDHFDEKTTGDIIKGIGAVLGAMVGAIMYGGFSFWQKQLMEVLSNGDIVGFIIVMLLPLLGFFRGAEMIYNIEMNKKAMLKNEAEDKIKEAENLLEK